MHGKPLRQSCSSGLGLHQNNPDLARQTLLLDSVGVTAHPKNNITACHCNDSLPGFGRPQVCVKHKKPTTVEHVCKRECQLYIGVHPIPFAKSELAFWRVSPFTASLYAKVFCNFLRGRSRCNGCQADTGCDEEWPDMLLPFKANLPELAWTRRQPR